MTINQHLGQVRRCDDG